MTSLPLALQPGFLWGVSTSAYQIEGAVDEGGRGPSIWDTFCAEPGRVRGGDTGAVAIDHFHRYPEDVALMRELGIGAYRFSIAWPRIVPSGSGTANEPGLDFYDRLVDELCAAGIAPVATLYHWDLPQPLETAGGWLARDTAYRFADYAAIVARRLADRVHMWAPLNEPAMVTHCGYGVGFHAPGKRLAFGAHAAGHHQLLGHGLAVRALRAAGASNVGIVNSHGPVWPASDGAADRAAAEAHDALTNRMFADPVLLSRYPSDELAESIPGPVTDDLAVIAEPLDWYGINYYGPSKVGAPGGGQQLEFAGVELPPELPYEVRPLTGYPVTGGGWPIVPDGLRELLVCSRDRYGESLPPVYIAENGCACDDNPDEGGRVADSQRIDYLSGHIQAVAAATRAGVDVRGYFVWSFADNFEWSEGYSQRFGLVHIDRDTLRRTPKDSYFWYRDLIKTNRPKDM